MINKFIKIFFIVLFLAGIIIYNLIESHVISISRKSMPMYIINDMDRSLSPKNQSLNEFFEDSLNIRIVPKNSIPLNAEYYLYEAIEYRIAENKLALMTKQSKYSFLYAQHLFNVHCSYCHNIDGKGNGAIITKITLLEDEEGYPNPPDLTDTATVNKSDERLFHILSAGQNLMMPVNHKLSDKERWALVEYLRFLQKNK